MTAWDMTPYTRPQHAAPGSIADLRNHMATAPISFDWWKGRAIVRTHGRLLGLAVERNYAYAVSLRDGDRKLDLENLQTIKALWDAVDEFMGVKND